jgi:hypothetical protein
VMRMRPVRRARRSPAAALARFRIAGNGHIHERISRPVRFGTLQCFGQT